MSNNSTVPATIARADFQYLHLITGLFVACLLIANTIAVKPLQFSFAVLPAGVVIFPLSYIFGDILTEVYGYARTRQVIWAGLCANVLMAFSYWIVVRLPAAAFWPNQTALAATLGPVPRIVVGSWIGYFAGEFLNSYVLARLKVVTRGRHLWVRLIGSTVVGQAVDTLAFTTIAFAGHWPLRSVWVAAASLYVFKVLYETAAMPISYVVVKFLKSAEGVDHYDLKTDFSPLRWGI
jgi:queuosine precursor transporter